MLKKTANRIIKEIKKNNDIDSIVFNMLSNCLIVYIKGNFKKTSSKKTINPIVKSFSNKKVQVKFDYPDFINIDGEISKNTNLITLQLQLQD